MCAVLGFVRTLDPLDDLISVGGVEPLEGFLGLLVVLEGGAQISWDVRNVFHAGHDTGTIPRTSSNKDPNFA